MKRKINLSIVVLAFLAIITTMIFMTVAFNTFYTGQVKKDLKLIAQFMYKNDMVFNVSETDSRMDDEELRVTVLDGEGNVLADNMADIRTMDNHAARPEVAEAMQKGEGASSRRSDTLGKNTYYYAMRMDSGNILRISRDADSVFRYIETIIPSILLVVASLFIASLITAHLLTHKLISPIKELTENMDGNYQTAYYEEFEPFILKIREQHAGLLKSSKMRQEFTANVTHELKTPLTSISGYAELIETGLASGDDTVRFARGIHKSANRLLTLINDIIRLSELDSEDKELATEHLNLYQLAATCVEMLEPNAEMHNVTISMHGEACYTSGNRMMIEELLYNLCDNAIRYNNENGSVLVDVHTAGDQVILVVKDTGIGISKEHQERIFERFYRVDKSRSKSTGGTGLGLAIVKHIVEKHHAKLEVESEIGQGTTMRVIFQNIKAEV